MDFNKWNDFQVNFPQSRRVYFHSSAWHNTSQLKNISTSSAGQMATAKPQLPGRLNEIKSDPADQEEWTSVALVQQPDSDMSYLKILTLIQVVFFFLDVNVDFHGVAFITGLGQVEGSSDLQDRKLCCHWGRWGFWETFWRWKFDIHIRVTHVGMN